MGTTNPLATKRAAQERRPDRAARERPHTLLRLLRRLLLLRRLRGLPLLPVGAASASDPLDPQPGRGRSRCFWLGLAALSAALIRPCYACCMFKKKKKKKKKKKVPALIPLL